MNVTYESTDGKSYPLTLNMRMRLKDANFHSYAWQAQTTARRYGERVDTWRKDAQAYPATIAFRGTHAQRRAKIDEFHQSIDRDIFYNSPGRLIWGGWYVYCFIRESQTNPVDWDLDTTENEVEIYCPNPMWIAEQSITIAPIQEQELLDTDKTYDLKYGYPYSYQVVQSTSKQIYIDHYAPCDFKAVLHGTQDNLNITIGNVHLIVDYAIPDGWSMVVDTREDISPDKHCYITDGYTDVNCFNFRNPTTTLLEKVQPGVVTVTYNRRTQLDLTIYRERSEPAWT